MDELLSKFYDDIYAKGFKAGRAQAIDDCVKVCYESDKSTHPSDLGDKIKALKEQP